jgi:hypothetical protein
VQILTLRTHPPSSRARFECSSPPCSPFLCGGASHNDQKPHKHRVQMLAFAAASIACLRLRCSLCLSIPKPTPSTLLPGSHTIERQTRRSTPRHTVAQTTFSPPLHVPETHATTSHATLWRYSIPQLPYVAAVLWREQLCSATTVCMRSIAGVWQPFQPNLRTQNRARVPKTRARSQC